MEPYGRRGGVPTRHYNNGWDASTTSRDDDSLATHDGHRNGFGGTPFFEVPLPVDEDRSSAGWTSYLPSILSRKNSKATQPEGGSSTPRGSARGGRVENQIPTTDHHRGHDSEYSEHPYYNKPSSRVFESRGANGDYSQDLGDLRRSPIPARKQASFEDLEVSLREEIERLEKEFRAAMKQFHLERLRADDLEKENRVYKAELEGLYREKVRADNLERENRVYKGELEGEKVRANNLERENREFQRELEGLSREKVRADNLERENRVYKGELEGEKVRANNLERENREFQRELEGLSREKVRADNLEKENREYEAKLKKKDQEFGELQSKLLGQASVLAAIEVKDAELKQLRNSSQDVRRENLELKSWKTEQEKKLAQDTSTAGQLRTKVADLTYAKVQLEKKEQQLTNQVQDQTKRINDLKQKNAVLMVKMGAIESQGQSFRDRLREERDKSSKLQKRNAELLQRKNTEIEESMQQSVKLMAPADNGAQDEDQTARERALKAQCSALKEQVESKDLETQSLKTRLREERETMSKLNERLRLCDLEIADLKNRIQDLEKRDSQSRSVEFVAPPKEYIGRESFLETEATPYLLDGAVQRVHEVAGMFARLLMKAMEQGKIDGMAVARNNFVRSISLGKAAPLKYVLEAITCKLLFQGFEHESFDLQDSSSGFLDMEQQRMDNFRQYKYLNSLDDPEQLVLTEGSLFTHFCRIKLESLSAAIPEIDSMVQEIISRTFERSSSSDDTSTDVATYLASKLGTTFVKLAVCVWQVHKLAFAFNPMARIFRVSQSEEFVEKYMESVIFQESESEDEDMPNVDISRVDFMVVPGFLINRIVVRSRVFVVTKPLWNTFQLPQQSGEIHRAPM